jgi:hypothetical protein
MIKQYLLSCWPSDLNEQVGMLRLEPEIITSLSGVTFSDGNDALDDFTGALYEYDGKKIGLIRYKNNPIPGTILVMNCNNYSPKELKTAVEKIGASLIDLIWIKSQ